MSTCFIRRETRGCFVRALYYDEVTSSFSQWMSEALACTHTATTQRLRLLDARYRIFHAMFLAWFFEKNLCALLVRAQRAFALEKQFLWACICTKSYLDFLVCDFGGALCMRR